MKLALAALLFAASLLQAAEVSIISGLYQSEKSKVAGSDAGGKSTIEIGGRYFQPFTNNMSWFGEGKIQMRSYDAPDGGKAPSDSTGLGLKGGVRMYFLEFSNLVLPYLGGSMGYISEKDATPAANTQSETSGVVYGGQLGFRFDVDRDFFFDLESQVFESALFVTEKTEAIDSSVEGAPSKTEKTRTDLYVRTDNALDLTFGLGYKF